MKRNLLIMIAVATIATAAVSMALSQTPDQEAAQDIGAPLPPRVDFAAAPASRLRLGMTALEVTRIMGEPAKVTHYVIGETEMTRLDFSAGPIPSKVMLADGNVSGVALVVFHVDKGDLPSFTRRAWPGMSSNGVRQVLGDANSVRRHLFYGTHAEKPDEAHKGYAEALGPRV